MKKLFTILIFAFFTLIFTQKASSIGISFSRISFGVISSAVNHAIGDMPFQYDQRQNVFNKFEVRGGGSFGGRRGGGSFGGFSRSRSSRNSFGSRRSSGSNSRSFSRSAPRQDPLKTPSFGGKRLSGSQARTRYGVPRRVESYKGFNEGGTQMNYRVNNYGGFSSGLMMGYLTGQMTSPWMYGARFFYTRPVYVENDDGTVDVYPPSFDVGKIFFSLIIIIAIIVFIRRAMMGTPKKINRSGYGSQSSFS